jgi:membrane-bound ClpP family serine protease
MPTWNDILAELGSSPSHYDLNRRKYLQAYHDYTGRNVISYYSGWLQKGNLAFNGIDFGIEDADKSGFMSVINGLDRTKGLDLFLHTPGGSIGATESIVDYLRAMFGNDIRAVVPQIAMSAGTMIACSCKTIIMGKHSNLGPIDPQIGGLPTHGIIEEYERAKKEVASDPSSFPIWQVIMSRYNPTLIGECEKAIEWSEQIVANWLKSNMFDGDIDVDEKVSAIISELGSHAINLSHDRHLHLELLKNRLKMKIEQLEDDQELQDRVLSIHHSTIISLTQTKAIKIIDNHAGKSYINTAG